MLIPHPAFIVNLAAESILMINILAMLGKVQFLTATRHFDENEIYIIRYCFKPGHVVSSVRLGATVTARAANPIAKIIMA